MNTVLDDNKMLCLANSERIKLNATIHMLFEVQDLAVASPATVSRYGMIFIQKIMVLALALWSSLLVLCSAPFGLMFPPLSYFCR